MASVSIGNLELKRKKMIIWKQYAMAWNGRYIGKLKTIELPKITRLIEVLSMDNDIYLWCLYQIYYNESKGKRQYQALISLDASIVPSLQCNNAHITK